MKYAKIALIGFMCASLFSSCGKEKDQNYGPGDATVFFTNLEDESEPATASIEFDVLETSGLFTVPLRVKGTPGGYPVIAQVTATVVSGGADLDDIAIITNQTIRITEDNNSYIQIDPVNRPNSFDDSVIKLTISEVKGANVGTTKECLINIKNVFAIKYGQYSFAADGGAPLDWTLVLREGPEGQYIAENLFDLGYLPKFLGVYDAETKKLTFDGRITTNGNVSVFNQQPGWGMYDGAYIVLMGGPLVFDVSEDWELTSMTGSLDVRLYKALPSGELDQNFLNPAKVIGGGSLTYAGELSDKDWPFDE